MRTNIEVSYIANKHIQTILKQSPGALGIRVGVKKAGCSGFKYLFEASTTINADDVVFEAEGLKVIVDPMSLPELVGLRIDYIENPWGFELDFQNPNIKSNCGCGQSFNTEK